MPRSKPLVPAPSTVARALDTLLEGAYAPPPGIVPNQAFTRRQDDTDGETGFEHQLSVGVTVGGDAWVLLPDRSLRFRVPFGGGASPRVQRALVVLAEAIRRDNQDNPQAP